MDVHSLLAKLPEKLRQNGLVRFASLPVAVPSEDARAPERRPRAQSGPDDKAPTESSGVDLHFEAGSTLELILERGSSRGVEWALDACRRAQAGPGRPWVACVDPAGALHAPGLVGVGLDLERLLVVRSEQHSLRRVTLRLVESRVFALVVVDLAGMPALALDVHLGGWVKVVRRSTLALRGTGHRLLLLTNESSPRSITLPVSRRIHLGAKGHSFELPRRAHA